MLINRIIALALLMLAYKHEAQAEGLWETVDIEHFSMELRSYDSSIAPNLGLRDSYLAPLDDQLTFGLGINGNLLLFRHKPSGVAWTFHNTWWFDSAESHVRHVGWQFEHKLALHKQLQLFYQHESRHVLEAEREPRFPVYDRVGVRVVFLDK